MENETVQASGNIEISEEVIATLAGAAAIECYGLVGMSGRKMSDGIGELLGRESLSKGVEVTIQDRDVIIDLYIIVNYGVRISEVANNVRDKVKYAVGNSTGLNVSEVNINVQGVRVNQ